MKALVGRRFQPGEGPSRGLLRDCTSGCGTDGSICGTTQVPQVQEQVQHQVPQVLQQVAGVFSSNSLQRPRRVSSGSGTRRPGSSEVRASATNNSCFLYSLIHNIKVIISLLLPRWGSLVTTPPRSPGAVSPWTRPCCSDTATSPRTPATTTTTTTTAWAQGPHLGPPPLCWPAWTSRYFRSGAKH